MHTVAYTFLVVLACSLALVCVHAHTIIIMKIRE